MACWGSPRAPGMAGEPYEPTDAVKLQGPNRPNSDEAFRRRGFLTIWFDPVSYPLIFGH